MDMTAGGGEATRTGGAIGGLRPWLGLLLGISGGAVVIACTLGLLVVLTSAAAQAQPGPAAAQPPDARADLHRPPAHLQVTVPATRITPCVVEVPRPRAEQARAIFSSNITGDFSCRSLKAFRVRHVHKPVSA